MNLDEFLTLSLDARRKAPVRPRPRGPYKRRPTRTPEQLVEYLRINDIRSIRQLRRKLSPEAPIPHDIIKAFGSWQAAKETAFGKLGPFDLPKRPDPKYLVNTAVELDLGTRDAYLAARRRRPDIVPSIHWVRALYGSWDRLKWATEQVSVKACLERWMTLRRRLGRTPTLMEAHQAGISFEPLKRIFKTSGELNEFLKDLARVADKQPMKN